jgi:wyosine [tRNA(Phe)-imidazoG37] synthetase (radical SAM superfamily)
VERKDYIGIENVLEELERKLGIGPAPDYISLAGSGEPTLNLGIGQMIRRIKELTETPVAVLTNGSLLWLPEVKEDLMDADLVLPSLDAGDEISFRYVNRPHRSISFEKMVMGTAEFTKEFNGAVWLEVLLLGGVTGVTSEVKKIAALINQINPDMVQLSTVSRPPAEDFAFTVTPEKMKELKKLIPGKVELIVENSHPELPTSHRPETDNLDILALLSRRPCTVQGISTGLGMNAGEVTKRLQCLNQQGEIRVVRSNDQVFYERVELRS